MNELTDEGFQARVDLHLRELEDSRRVDDVAVRLNALSMALQCGKEDDADGLILNRAESFYRFLMGLGPK